MIVKNLTVKNALVFDGESADLKEGDIFIENGQIVEQAQSHDARTIDAGGRFVMPGLIDAHLHAYAVSNSTLNHQKAVLSYVALAGSVRLRNALHRGFTTVLDLAGGDSGLTTAIDEGLIPGPRYLFSGPSLIQSGGTGDPRRPDDLEAFGRGHMIEIVDGSDAVRLAVRERIRSGAHAIKIRLSGGIHSSSLYYTLKALQYSPEEVAAASDEAERCGSYVAAHAYSAESILHGVRNGVHTIEHGNYLNDECASEMLKHEVALVPTLATYDALNRLPERGGQSPEDIAVNRDVLDAGIASLSIAKRYGIPTGFGTDLIGDLESEQLCGLRIHADVLGAGDALRSATSVNATIMRRDDLGRTRPGSVGDLLILDGNPFDDFEHLADPSAPRLVVKGGVAVHSTIEELPGSDE